MYNNGKETLEIRILRKIENKLLKILETNQASLFYWKYCKSKQAHSGKLPSSSRCGKEAAAFFCSGDLQLLRTVRIIYAPLDHDQEEEKLRFMQVDDNPSQWPNIN